MLEWISQHSNSLMFFTNVGTLLIWLVYAQLLYLGFRRQRRPRLIINRGKKKDIEALCIISNMSAESVFIEYIIVELETSVGTVTMDFTDYVQEYSEGDEEEESRAGRRKRNNLALEPLRENTRQGPLASGDFLHIGSFDVLIRRLASSASIKMDGYRPRNGIQFHRLTIRLICVYGPEDMPVGAERSFRLDDDDHSCSLTPVSWDTKRLATRRQRRKLRNLVAELNDSNFISSSTIRERDKDDGMDEGN